MSFGPRIPFNECAALTFRTNFQNIFNRTQLSHQTALPTCGADDETRPHAFGGDDNTACSCPRAKFTTAYALGSAASIFLHLVPLGLMAIGLAVGLVETIIAGVVGASLYRKGSTEGLKSSAARA